MRADTHARHQQGFTVLEVVVVVAIVVILVGLLIYGLSLGT